MTKFEARIQQMYFDGYTIQRIVNQIHSEIGVTQRGKKTKADVRNLVENALLKIKWRVEK